MEGSGESDCGEATDEEEPMDEEEGCESPYETEDEAVSNKSERLDLRVIKITACEPYTMAWVI